MAFNAVLQRVAESVRPEHLGSALVLAAALFALGYLVRKRPRDAWRAVPAVLFILATSGWLLAASVAGVPAVRWWPAGVAALAALVVHLAVGGRAVADQAAPACRRDWVVGAYLLAAGAIAAVFLFRELGTYAGTMMVWEPSVLSGFGDALRDRVGVARYFWHTLLWSEGLVSNGDESLLYGGPTYALLKWAGVSLLNLRVVSAVLAWLCLPAVFWTARKFGGAFVATAAAVLMACSVPLVYYGRYGTSLAGSLLGVIVAIGCCWLFLEERGGKWWGGLLCGVALFVATLGYSPARLGALLLCGVVAGALLVRWRRIDRGRLLGIVALVAALGGALALQVMNQTEGRFLSARGEQVFTMMEHRDVVREYLGKPISPSDMTAAERLELMRHLLGKRLHEYLPLLGQPLLGETTVENVLGGDPPVMPFFYGPLLPFLLWGLAISLFRLRSLHHQTMVGLFLAESLPLLLTTRVDAHRALLLLIPLVFWAAVGLREGAKVMGFAGVPRYWQHALVVGLVVTAALANADAVYYPNRPPHLAGQVLSKEITSTPGPVVLGATIDQREVGEADLALIERMRRTPADRGSLLPESILRALEDNPSPAPQVIEELKPMITGGTLILAPAGSFAAAAAGLARSGCRVDERGPADARFLVIRPPSVATSSAGGFTAGGPAQAAAPSPAVVPLRSGPAVPLDTLKPERVEFGFAPPLIDRNWSGGKLVLGGVEYKEGIGMHAWCRMTYPVPDKARAFQALVGLDDDARGCSVALVSFELQDDRGRVLFDSGLIGPGTPPRAVYVPLAGERSVTLVATEGGNGRDCDHADWAEPAFLFGEQPTREKPARR